MLHPEALGEYQSALCDVDIKTWDQHNEILTQYAYDIQNAKTEEEENKAIFKFGYWSWLIWRNKSAEAIRDDWEGAEVEQPEDENYEQTIVMTAGER